MRMADKPDGERDAGRARLSVGRPGALQRRLTAGEFAVTAEIGPPRGADTAPVARKARCCAAGSTRSTSPTTRAPPSGCPAWPAAWPRSRRGSSRSCSSPAVTGTGSRCSRSCCPRRRSACRTCVIMTGDHPRHGDHADAKPVFDLDSTQLLRVATAMRDQGRLMSGGELKPPPAWFLGAVENPPGRRRRRSRRSGRGGRGRPGHLPAGQQDRGRRAVRADPVRLRCAGVRRLDAPDPRSRPARALLTSWPAWARSGRSGRWRTWLRFPASSSPSTSRTG